MNAAESLSQSTEPKTIEAQRIRLVSPNGKFSIEMMATDTCAGIWIRGDESSSMVAIYNERFQGSVIGVYDSKQDGASHGLAAALHAKEHGGHLQLVDRDGNLKSFD